MSLKKPISQSSDRPHVDLDDGTQFNRVRPGKADSDEPAYPSYESNFPMEAIVSVSDEHLKSQRDDPAGLDHSEPRLNKQRIKNALLDNQCRNDPLAKRLDPAFFEIQKIEKSSQLQSRSMELENEIQSILQLSSVKP